MKGIYCVFFLGGGGHVLEDFNKGKVPVIAEMIKLCSYLQVGKILIRRMFQTGWDDFKCLCSGISLIWQPHDWKVAGLLNVPFIKQHLY
jgi:hypothetical protein